MHHEAFKPFVNDKSFHARNLTPFPKLEDVQMQKGQGTEGDDDDVDGNDGDDNSPPPPQ